MRGSDVGIKRVWNVCGVILFISQGTGGVNIVMLENVYSYFKTLLVTGGYDNEDYFSSTEIFTLDTDRWVSAASLPSPRDGLSGATLGNSVFVFGKIYSFTLHLT